MVYIVNITDIMCEAKKIVNGSKNVALGYMLAAKIRNSFACHSFYGVDITVASFHDLAHNRDGNSFIDTAILKVTAYKVFGFNRFIGDHLQYKTVFKFELYFVYARALYLKCKIVRKEGTGIADDLACYRRNGRLYQYMTGNSLRNCHLFIEFISSDSGYIVTSCIEEKVIDKRCSGFDRRRFARAYFFIYFFKSFNTDT